MKTIGRSTTADFIVDAGMESRFHCRLTVADDGRVELKDLNSTNGTYVNDERVDKAALSEGDRVRMGRVELVLADAATVAPDQDPDAKPYDDNDEDDEATE
jgi:pSer/pThr/pTyr-binding forkhead associated (FHA) protein